MATIKRQRVSEYEEKIPETLDKFKYWEFSSGSSRGEDFQIFSRLFIRFVSKNLPPGSKLVDYSRGHYYVSGFIEKGGKYVYFSISDVRHFGDWATNILVRTAKSAKDYTGGVNKYTTLERFSIDTASLLNRKENQEKHGKNKSRKVL